MVSFIDDFVSRADADAFEAMLQGTTPPSPAMSDLLSLTQQVASVPVPGPDPSFVAGLAATLRTEAAAVAASPPTPAPAPVSQPSVLTIHGTWPKVLAGAAAGVVVAGTGLGVASQGALPGDALYAVRGVVDGLEVRLAGSDGAQGRTLLAHAREHVADTSALADRTPQVADDIRTSLSDAAASVESGQTELFAAFDDTREPDHLRVVQEFTSWVQPQLQTLRQKVPAEALGELAALQSTVDKGSTELRAKLVACGESCSGIAVPAPGPSATTSPSSPAPSTTAPPSTSPSPPSPSSPTTIPPLLTSPGATVTVPAPSVPSTPGRTTRPQRPTTVPDEPRPRPTTDPTRTRTPRPTAPRPTTTDADPTPTRSTSTPTPSGPRPCPPGQVWVPLPGTDLGTCLPKPKVPTVTATIVLLPVVVPPVVVPDAPDVTVPDAPDLPGAPEPEPTAPAAPEPSEPGAPEPPVTPPAETVTPLPSIPTSAAPGLPGPTAPVPTTTSAAPTPTATTTEPVPTTPAPTPTSSTTEPTPTQTTPAPTPTSTTTEPVPTTPAPTTPAPSDIPTGVLVTPEAPRFADHCVPGNGIVHLPRTTGVSYEWDRRIGLITTTVVVDATPEPGYAFAPGTTSRWTRDYPGTCGSD
ncbi:MULTISPECIES: hypothetical protein [Arsenicicoccus]|uniref:hypothetical protein n=1 Tax=Arsenicicoccus TaxID=267408 RepID=UPI002579A549|nr:MULTISPECIES: hypothetical protein [Arsenicicoccus]